MSDCPRRRASDRGRWVVWLAIACSLAPWAAVYGLYQKTEGVDARALTRSGEVREEAIQRTVDGVASYARDERLRSCQADERARGAQRAFILRFLPASQVPDYFLEPPVDCEGLADVYERRLRSAGPLVPAP